MKNAVGLTEGSPSIEDAILSSDETTRIIARAAASQWMQAFTEWLNDEAKRSSHTNLLKALAQVQIMMHSSFAAGVVKPSGYAIVLQLYNDMLQSNYVAHAHQSAEANRKLARLDP